MQLKNQQLRQEILRIAEQEESQAFDFSILDQYKNHPVFLMAPMSYAGIMHGEKIANSMNRIIAAIDDQTLHLNAIHGAPRWSSQDFIDKAKHYPDAIAIDLSCSPRGRAFAQELCTSTGMLKISISPPESSIIKNYENRPVFFISARSSTAQIHGPGIVNHSPNVIAAIDDGTTASALLNVPRWSTDQFLERIKNYPDALVVDFSTSLAERGFNRKLCELAGAEKLDVTLVLAHCGLHAVYEPIRVYRQRTLMRIHDFLRIADRLEGEFDVFTLYSNLLYRLTYNHDYLEPIWATPSNEYFSSYGDSSTFQLGQREHFCDCGAYQGPIVQRFLHTTGYRYESITAFEPDSINYEKLKSLSSSFTPNFRPIKKAVSNKEEVLQFHESGTMGSYITPGGKVCIPTARLDDELEHLTFLKMDIEGFEAKALEGASRLISTQRPRMAICVYHYAQDLLDVMEQLDKMVDGYHFRLRQHSCAYYYDLILYASPVAGASPPPWAQ